MAYAPGVPNDVVLFTGPLILGFMFNWCLLGVLVAQAYYYYIHFPQDSTTIKALVYGLFVWELIQSVIVARDAFAFFGTGWGDPSIIHSAEFLWLTIPFMGGIISAAVQCFYTWRIWVLSRSKILATFIILVALVGCATGMAEGIIVKTALKGSNADLQTKTAPVTTAWLVSSATGDIVICTCMMTWYWRTRRRVAFGETKDLITRVIRLSVASGFLTSAFAILDITMFLTFRDNNFHLCPALALGKLYSNSLLALLNQRYRVDDGHTSRYLYDSDIDTVRKAQTSLGNVHPGRALRFSPGSGAQSDREASRHAIAVTIDRQQEIIADGIGMKSFSAHDSQSDYGPESAKLGVLAVAE